MPPIDPGSGLTTEAHPELFDIRGMPAQPTNLKPGQFTEDKIRHFFEKVRKTNKVKSQLLPTVSIVFSSL